jgi:ribosome-binding factor A
MKRTPRLTFEYDASVEYGVRMTKLIDEIAPAASDDDDAH